MNKYTVKNLIYNVYTIQSPRNISAPSPKNFPLRLVQPKRALNHKKVLCVEKKTNITGPEEDREAIVASVTKAIRSD